MKADRGRIYYGWKYLPLKIISLHGRSYSSTPLLGKGLPNYIIFDWWDIKCWIQCFEMWITAAFLSTWSVGVKLTRRELSYFTLIFWESQRFCNLMELMHRLNANFKTRSHWNKTRSHWILTTATFQMLSLFLCWFWIGKIKKYG